MKPICVTCGVFFRMKTSGYAFEEGMPVNGAVREMALRMRHGAAPVRFRCQNTAPSPRDIYGRSVQCQRDARHDGACDFDHDEPIRYRPGRLDGWQSYKLWLGDLWECRCCGAQIIVGAAQVPLAEHYQPDYPQQLETSRATLRIDDC